MIYNKNCTFGCTKKLFADRKNAKKILLIFSLTVITILIIFPLSSLPAYAVVANKWTEYSGNPVFNPTAKAYYPTVVKISDTSYKMWYGSDSGVGYATSTDGIGWTQIQNPVNGLANAGHPHVEYYPSGFSCGASTCLFRIWYWDENQLYSVSAIRYAESVDGINWINDQPITGNIITGIDGDWNKGSYGPIDVLYNATAANAGTNPFGYSFAMYFDGTSGGVEAIGLGYSPDGKNWTSYGKVLPTGAVGTWDSSYTTFGTVIKEDVGNWQMWYSGGISGSSEGIGCAESTDGLTWTRADNNPIMKKTDGVTWRDGRTYTPSVIKDGSTWKMWFSGQNASSGKIAIGYATINILSCPQILNNTVITIVGHDVTIRHPPSLGNDYHYHYSDGLTINYNGVGGIGFNGKTFDITKYGSSIPQQALQIGQSANFTFKVYDERGPKTLSHVGMYMHFKGDTIVTNSDTSIVWDKHDGIKVTDPQGFFSDASTSIHYDNNFAYVSIQFTPAKAMTDSSILMRMWDDKLSSIDLPILGAIIILDPNAPVVIKEVPSNQYGDYNTLVNMLDADGYQMPAILHKIKSGADISPVVNVYWIYDKGVDKLVMVEAFKDGTMIGDTVFNLLKKQPEPSVTAHDYVYMPMQNNRQNSGQEKALMLQEEFRAEKILESMHGGTRQVP